MNVHEKCSSHSLVASLGNKPCRMCKLQGLIYLALWFGPCHFLFNFNVHLFPKEPSKAKWNICDKKNSDLQKGCLTFWHLLNCNLCRRKLSLKMKNVLQGTLSDVYMLFEGFLECSCLLSGEAREDVCSGLCSRKLTLTKKENKWRLNSCVDCM